MCHNYFVIHGDISFLVYEIVNTGISLGCPWTQFGSIAYVYTLNQCVHVHALMHVYTLIMCLLMNYKQTLRPYTYVPLMSGFMPNDKPHKTKDKDRHTHTQTHTHHSFVLKQSFLICIMIIQRYTTTSQHLLFQKLPIYSACDCKLCLLLFHTGTLLICIKLI